MEWQAQRVSVRGLPLAYHTAGDPAAPPLVLLHGFQDHGRTWAAVAERLVARRFLVAPDHRGHGDSGWVGDGGDYVFYDYYQDLRLITEAAGLSCFALLGHSMGGNIATGFAALFPERVSALILLEGMGFVTHGLAESASRLRKWSDGISDPAVAGSSAERRLSRRPMAGLEQAAARLMTYNPRLAPALAAELAGTFTEPAPQGGVVWRFDPLHKVPAAKPYLRGEAEALWRAVAAPVLSLFGEETSWVPPDLSARHAQLRQVRYGVVQGAGHNLHHDRPELVARAVDAFLDDSRAGLPEGVTELPP